MRKNSKLKFNALGRTTEVVNWTDLALHCYMRKCACSGCLYSQTLESGKCQMKATVLELIKLKQLPRYTLVEQEYGTSEYHILGRNFEGKHGHKEKVYSKYREYLNDEVIDLIENIDLSLNARLVAGLFIAGLSKEKICSILNKPRQNINAILTTIYLRTQAEVKYKTKHGKLEEFIEYYRSKLDE